MRKKSRTFLDARKLELHEWLDLILSPRQDQDFIDYEFPTEHHRTEYLSRIGERSEEEVIAILQHFLIPSTSLRTDEFNLEWYLSTSEKNPELHQKLSRRQYYQRLLLWGGSGGRTPPPWEGITWILDLLPHYPRSAIHALDAYFLAHIQLLPDGRFRGLGEAAELIRAKFIGSPETVSERIELLMDLNPRHFECIVERLYNKMGYKTQLTAEKSDGGRDVLGSRGVPGQTEQIRIECKRYTRPVGVIVARALLGVVAHEKVNKGLIVATSTFTKAARKFAYGNPRLELISGCDLVPLLNEYLGLRWPLHVERLVVESLGKGQKQGNDSA